MQSGRWSHKSVTTTQACEDRKFSVQFTVVSQPLGQCLAQKRTLMQVC